MPALRDPQREQFCRKLVEEYLAVPASSSPVQAAYERAGFRPDSGNCYRLARRPEVRQRVRELTAEALEYSDIRIAQVAVRLNRIATATISEYYEPNGRLKAIDTLPDRLAEAVREIEFDENRRPKRIRLHDKLGALTTLMKPLGGFPDERGAAVTNNTQVNVITDEERVAALMVMLAQAKSSGEIPPGETQH
jgi:phage terminase small subunit